MQYISEILAVLNSQLSCSNIANFGYIVQSILSLSCPVTSLSVSRMSPLSYRTVHRFYSLGNVNWLLIRLLLFKHFLYDPNAVYILVADETVEQKAGKHTFGLARFYSSLSKSVIPSVSFLGLSLVNVLSGKSSFLGLHQLVKPVCQQEDTGSKCKAKFKSKKGKGRPKGSKNKVKQENKTLSYQSLKTLLSVSLSGLGSLIGDLPLFHLVLDGQYGSQDYLALALQNKLHIISKLNYNASLRLPYCGEQKKRGRKRLLGKKVDLENIPVKYFQYKEEQNDKQTLSVYQFRAYANNIKGILINVVVLIKFNHKTKKTSRVILFSSDLNLTAQQIIKYYELRFQIEFDFRDAKQYFGLSDFKNYKQTQLNNAVNIAFTMTLIAKILLEKYKKLLRAENMGILDLKACIRTQRLFSQLFNKAQKQENDFFNSQEVLNIVKLQAIHI